MQLLRRLKFFKLKFIIIFCVILNAACARADLKLKPENALSPCPDNSVYFALKLDNVSELLRWALSEQNLRLAAPLLKMGEDDIEMINSIASKIPCEALMALIGVDERGKTFFKAAASFPDTDEYKNILKLVTRGEAKPEDINFLLLGKDSPLASLAESIIKVIPEPNKSGVMRVNNTVLIGARENLLVIASTPEAVKTGLAAANNKAFRINLNRELSADNFIFAHADIHAVIKNLNRRGRTRRVIRPAYLRLIDGMFQAPLDIEADFELLPENFKIHALANLKEALTEKNYNKLAENAPVSGGHINLNISESPFLAFGTDLNINLFRDIPAFERRLRELVINLEQNGVSWDLFNNLINGALAVNIGGNFISMGLFKIPDFYLAKTGINGAAASFIEKMPRDNASVVKSEGWDILLKAPVTVSPVPLYIGARDEILYFGVFEPKLINQAEKADKDLNNFAPNFQDLINKNSLTSFYIDFEALQNYLKREIRGALNFAAVMLGGQKEISLIKNFLDVKLSVPSISVYAPDYGEIIINFALKDVHPEDGLWSKIIKVMQ